MEANTNWQDYKIALKISFTGGYKIVLKRHIKEILVNSYNPNWSLAWDANLDLQICLDYFAVITYITDYFSKDDTGTLQHIKEAAKQFGRESLREKLNIIKNVFLTHRQMGEAEAIYRLLPSLHLKESNLATKFVPTGFPENRSKFLQKLNEDNEYMSFGREVVTVDGKEDKYVEKPSIVSKYERRDSQSHPELLTLAISQFGKEYESTNTVPKKYLEKLEQTLNDDDNDSDDHDDDNANERRIHTSKGPGKPLPRYFKLDPSYPGEPKYMRLRTHPAALRFYKGHKNNHEFFYSEVFLYTPFKKECNSIAHSKKGLKEYYEDEDICREFYNRGDVQMVKKGVMEHLESVAEGRRRVEESEEANKMVGTILDPFKEQENEDCKMEGVIDHPDHFALDPGEFLQNERVNNVDKSYRKIELEDFDKLAQKTRMLDPEQRQIVDTGIKYAKDLIKSLSGNFEIPKAQLLITQGGAGSGKSTVINILSQWIEYFLRRPGDAPNMPYVIKAAFSGSAAIVIDGQTLHNAFSFRFGNEFISLNDANRDKTRTILRNLKVVIIDEMSMITSDMFFKLHLRLCEIKQCHDKLFGGVSLYLFGDLMQLSPINGRYIFQQPFSPTYHDFYDDSNIWKSFDVLNLITNHRQGDSQRYADLLNRMRVGKMTKDDIKLLKTRVRPTINHADIPNNSLKVFCTNKEVNYMNELKLEMNPNDEYLSRAYHICDTQQNFKPLLQYGKVKNTPCLNELKFKIGSEVMLTYNLDVCDYLANGSRGTVIGITTNQNGKLQYILVQFHDPKAGKERRKKFPSIQKDYPDNLPTPIEKLDFSYSLSKKAYSKSTMAKVVQYPLVLGESISGHKSQGTTVKKPTALVTDLRGVWPSARALAYVICSRVESIDQLFIIGDLPQNKFMFSQDAKEEMERLEEISINKNPKPWYKMDGFDTKIACLNIRSLNKHLEDVKADHTLLKSDIICLTETWLQGETSNIYSIDGYNTFLNSVGKGKGIAIYAKPSFSHVCDVNGDGFQITKMTSEKIDVICVYRSDFGFIEEVVKQLFPLFTPLKATFICGDFNICALKNPQNLLTQSLTEDNFQQIIKYSTHEKGGLLEHVYVKNISKDCNVHYHAVYYSDHEGMCITILENQPNIEKKSQKRKHDANKDMNESKKRKIIKNKDKKEQTAQNVSFDCYICCKSEAKCSCYAN